MATQSLLLPVGRDFYALPVDAVREVVAAPTATELVTAPPMVLGLFNLRGQIVPLLDTAALLGLGDVGPMRYAVVVDCPQGLAGLAVTEFPQRGVLESATAPSELPATDGLYRVGDQVVALLDPAELLTSDRLAGSAQPPDRLASGVS
jgi:chemotaxis signal transduction protein